VIPAIDAELAGHADKLDIKTAEFVWKWFFFVCCAHSCQALPLWSNPTKNLQKQRWGHSFTLKFEWHNRYDKLLLCNSKINDVA